LVSGGWGIQNRILNQNSANLKLAMVDRNLIGDPKYLRTRI